MSASYFPIRSAPALYSLLALSLSCSLFAADDFVVHRFDRQQLTNIYYSEGVGVGDIDGDGHPDVVYGPYWYAGPDFTTGHEIYPPVAQPLERYADHFFAWVYDFNGDGHADVFTVGFPGTPAYVYEKPGPGKRHMHWKKHEVFDWVSNESPHFVSLVGDDRPELVCTRDGYFGYATIDWEKPFEKWTFHPISERIATPRFGHGLGVGDVNGDGLADVIHVGGWFQQPAENPETNRWLPHAADFTNAYGGAEMHAYDVDGDGDADIVCSLAAHDFGLAWYEQIREGDEVTFKMHQIMGAEPDENRYGLVFSELHSVQMADIDGDGLLDIITGKTFRSHHEQSPMWDAGAVVYWFKLVRTDAGVDWIPHRADGEAGIGRQVGVFDIDGDGQLDIVSGGMKGCHVLKHRPMRVERKVWKETQPEVRPVSQRTDRGELPEFDAAGKIAGAIEAESLDNAVVAEGKSSVQKMNGFRQGRWSGDEQLFWTGGKPGNRLVLKLTPPAPGRYDLAAVFTTAPDYATIRLFLDDAAIGETLDLFSYPHVKTTGLVPLGTHQFEGARELAIEITGCNPAALKRYAVGLDCVQLMPRK